MKNNGFFVISLDFELLWGVFDVVDFQKKKNYFQNTNRVIPEILNQFSAHNIHATWAVVGMLFNRNWREWEENIPANKPTYLNNNLSAYDFGQKIKNAGTEDLCFAPSLIEQIIQVPNQEIGTHTYSHYYCMEEEQSPEQFKTDLKLAIKLAVQWNIELRSLVFPRNQLNKEYLKICSKLGIDSVRSNPDEWYWKDPSSETLANKIFRTGEAYNILAKRKSYPLADMARNQNLPLAQKASRFLRPHGNNEFLNRLRMKRIKSEMLAAAKNNEVYHLWWHPHNFGEQPEKSLSDLDEILKYFVHCRDNYNFKSLNMAELNELVNTALPVDVSKKN